MLAVCNAMQERARLLSVFIDVLCCLMVTNGWRESASSQGSIWESAARARDQRPLNSDLTFLRAITRLPPAVCLRIVLLRARLAHLPIICPVPAASSEVRVAGTSLTASVARVDPHPFQPCRAAESSTASDIVFDHNTQRPLIQ